MRKYIYYSAFFILLLCQCSRPTNQAKRNIQIEFDNIASQSTSILKDLTFIKLETDHDVLLDDILQVEIIEENIYLLSGSGLHVFDLSGNHIKSLRAVGNGPGEFLFPYSFWIDKEGFIFILDRQLNRLQKYVLEDLEFVETIKMPYDSPIGFAKIDNRDAFVYYYPLRPGRGIEEKQLFVADEKGKIRSALHPGNASGKILHGNSSNFYRSADKLRFYPYFSEKIYEIDIDSLYNIYTLSFKANKFPDQDVFTKYDNSGDIMKEILSGTHQWIRLIYIYETENHLVVKYYIEKDFYIAVWDKTNNATINFRHADAQDNLGIGGKFPLPIGVYGSRFIGVINPYDIDKDSVTNVELKKLTDNLSEEDNPILCFYTFSEFSRK